MGRNREVVERVADVLKAVSDGRFYKSGIMEAANLNSIYASRILDVALASGFLVVNNRKYGITETGKSFLENFKALTCSIDEVKSSLEKLKDERQALACLVYGSHKNTKEQKIKVNEKEQLPVINILLKRIDPVEFYHELTELGFTGAAALEIISWIDLIYKKDKFFFSGKKATGIKACLACNGAFIFREKNVTRNKVVRFFKGGDYAVRAQTMQYRRFLMEEKPELFKER